MQPPPQNTPPYSTKEPYIPAKEHYISAIYFHFPKNDPSLHEQQQQKQQQMHLFEHPVDVVLVANLESFKLAHRIADS